MTGQATPTPAAVGTPQVRRLSPGDVDAAAEVLSLAFAEEPGSRAFFPDPEERHRIGVLKARNAVRATVPYAGAFGAERDGRLVGVALWHPPNVTARSLPATVELLGGLLGMTSTIRRAVPRVGALVWSDREPGRRLMRLHRQAVRVVGRPPAWYLAVLGTHPDHRGRGVARVLLDHVLDRCDEDGLPAWLETTDPANPPLYERFGFHTVAHAPGGRAVPPLWVMRRVP